MTGMSLTARRTLKIVAVLAVAGVGLGSAAPAEAFYGSFWASCRHVRIYGGGNYMTAWCRRIDGSWNYTSIYNCGGAGVHNDDGYLACGT